jgi:Trk-type K+ transport system membrane component
MKYIFCVNFFLNFEKLNFINYFLILILIIILLFLLQNKNIIKIINLNKNIKQTIPKKIYKTIPK